MGFFKALGKGILYVFGLPILLVFLAVYLVISIFGFIVVGIKALVLFFKGDSIHNKLPEDEEAEKRMQLLLNPLPTLMEQIQQIKENKQALPENNVAAPLPVADPLPIENKQVVHEVEPEIKLPDIPDIEIPEEFDIPITTPEEKPVVVEKSSVQPTYHVDEQVDGASFEEYHEEDEK